MIDAWTNMSKMRVNFMKSDASPRSRSLVSKWVKESCWKSNCYDKLKIILIRSSIRMPEITPQTKTYTSRGTVIANITTLLSPTITWATWKVLKVIIRMDFSHPKDPWKTQIKSLDLRAGVNLEEENLNRKEMFLIRWIATCVENHNKALIRVISIGRWDL